MRGSHYTAEQNTFITENYLVMTYPELTARYNEQYGASMTVSAMGKKCRSLRLPQKERGYSGRFTAEADEYIRENAFIYTAPELSVKLAELFGIHVATQTVTDRINRLGIHRGTNFTPAGRPPRSSKPIGTERVEKGKNIKVKVAQPDVWMPKAAVVMGYDPKKYQAIFLDGNSLNVVPENIVVVSKKIHARLAKNGWLNSSKEVLLTGIRWCEHYYALKDFCEGD